MEVTYAFQDPQRIPEGFEPNPERIKPLGTAHAVWSAKNEISAPFAVMNTDDFYGAAAFQQIFAFLENGRENYGMVAYKLQKTLSAFGTVSRGVCRIDDSGNLMQVTEHKNLTRTGEDQYIDGEGNILNELTDETPVSMNLWGFPADFPNDIEKQFADFYQHKLKDHPLTAEFFLPDVVQHLISHENKKVKVLHTQSEWMGVTYPEDKIQVQQKLKEFSAQKTYSALF